MTSAEAFLRSYRTLADEFHALDERAQQDVRLRLRDLEAGASPVFDPGLGQGIFLSRLNSDLVPDDEVVAGETTTGSSPSTPDEYVRNNLNATYGMLGHSYRVTSWTTQGPQLSRLVYALDCDDACSQAEGPVGAVVSAFRIYVGVKDIDPKSPLARRLGLG